MSDQKVSLEDIVSLCKRRGFVYQGSEIYGGLAGTWDYGPLGVALKRNIQNVWQELFVDGRDNMYQVDAAILMNQKVWQASGHVDTFTDPMIECINCHARFRADSVIEDAIKKNQNSSSAIAHEKNTEANLETNIKILKPHCQNCGNSKWSKPERFNMMFKTVVGPKYISVEGKTADSLDAKVLFNKHDNPEGSFTLKDEYKELSGFMFYDKNSVSYLRPETAQGIFTNYRNIVDSFYPNLPFGIAQIGKAFRNEISPRDFLFRAREFEQMEIEYFIDPKDWEKLFEKWIKDVELFLEKLKLPKAKIHKLEVSDSDRAHYSKRTIDFEYDFPHGRHELLGLAYRTDFDLQNIQRVSGRNMEYRPKDGSKVFVPHVIEPSFGIERALMAVLSAAYTEDEVNGEKRVYLKLPVNLAPVKVAISPLLKNKPELVDKAKEVYKLLQKEVGAAMWDDNGNIGKRYRRQDEIGTPACVVIDFDTLEDDTVTVRDRDTTKQERVKISELVKKLKV